MMSDPDLERLLDLHARLNLGTVSGEKFSEFALGYKSLKSKIEQELEKAKRYDLITDYGRVINPELFVSESFLQLEQQIKELKEELNKINDFVGHITLEELVAEIQSLKEKIKTSESMYQECILALADSNEKLEKYERLQDGATNILNYLKTERLLAQELAYDFVICFKEILDEDEK